MEAITSLLDFFLHLDKHLDKTIQNYGVWTHLILFGIVFCETGLVVTPFLPGDSLLFAAGIFAGYGSLNYGLLSALLVCAALLGDTTNYCIGKFLGPRIFRSDTARFLKREHLDRTHRFFEKYGGKTIIIARFVPIVRTFAPFVAGIGAMTFRRFILYSICAALLWVGVCVSAGYFFGRLPIVKNNFSLAILAIIFISVMPAFIEFLKHRREARSRLESVGPAVSAEE